MFLVGEGFSPEVGEEWVEVGVHLGPSGVGGTWRTPRGGGRGFLLQLPSPCPTLSPIVTAPAQAPPSLSSSPTASSLASLPPDLPLYIKIACLSW